MSVAGHLSLQPTQRRRRKRSRRLWPWTLLVGMVLLWRWWAMP